MPSAFLGLNGMSAATGTPQVRRYNGLSATVVGNTFGASATTAIDANAQPMNRVIQFGAQDTFLALVINTVYRSTNAGATWTAVFTFPGVSDASGIGDAKSGLNVIYKNGLPTVCFMSGLAAGFTGVQGYYSLDGVTWISDTSTSYTGNVSCSADTVYRNALYVCAPPSTVQAYSPGSPIALANTPATETPTSGSLCVFNDQLMYMSIAQTPTTTRRIYVLSGGAWQLFSTLDTPGAITSTGKCSMFVDSNSGDLIAFNRKSVPGAWGCWSVNSAGVATDISSTVLPASMLASSPSTAMTLAFVDGEIAPNSNPEKYLIYSTSNVTGTLQSMYKWNGVSTTMTDIDTGGSIRDAYTLNRNCQGIGSWTSGENSVFLLDRVPVSGGMRLYFTLYSSTGLATVNVNARYGTSLQEYPLTLGTISAASNGSIIANVNTGLTADNGVTTYYFTWNSNTDGVPGGDRFRLVLEVSI